MMLFSLIWWTVLIKSEQTEDKDLQQEEDKMCSTPTFTPLILKVF